MTGADEFNLGSLPYDALYHIASFLDGEDLLSLALIARSISSIASDCHLWRALLRRTYGQRRPNDSETGTATNFLTSLPPPPLPLPPTTLLFLALQTRANTKRSMGGSGSTSPEGASGPKCSTRR